MRTKHRTRLEEPDLKTLRREGTVQSYYKRKRSFWLQEETLKDRAFPQKNLRFGELLPNPNAAAYVENQTCTKQFLPPCNECTCKVPSISDAVVLPSTTRSDMECPTSFKQHPSLATLTDISLKQSDESDLKKEESNECPTDCLCEDLARNLKM
ncbi:hypothetical protein Aperf_G00000105297 [Anoplocephala perfoliata]